MVLLASEGTFDDWAARPEGTLALILLLHFVQNSMFANTVLENNYLPRVEKLCLQAVERGQDRSLDDFQRAHIYVAMMSSRPAKVRQQGRALFDGMKDHLTPEQLAMLQTAAEQGTLTV
ncbi:hypothetical protein GCM10022278_08190 [Allohahella marinimesophila]|uniref:Uncharacterized protein n=2 Tax=Allohahella marinimesophila TaxID=1054972 RepID=A0ABP7NPF0_9GAMM